nr:RNA-directed DNA polymerase, eukaryota [Tanacetum cinerariifolium]
MGSFKTKEDQAIRISKSIFVTNFLDRFGTRDLWNLFQVYGKVVDVFVPNRKSKPGKRVKDLNSIPNLKMILIKEGFREIKLSYVVGLWVMIKLSNEETKIELLQHTGAKSWFHELQVATSNFVSEERIVWVDIEGIPLSVWSHATFSKIGKKWRRDVVNIEQSTGSLFARKRLCIKTSLAKNILETFKVIFKEMSQQEKHNDASVHVREKCHESPTQKENSRAVHSTTKDPIVSEPSSEFSTSFHSRKTLNGGLILDVLDDIIKDGVSVFDNFIALYGTWLPNNTKILIVVIYAPQSIALKRTLWEYISVLINCWNIETLVLGDFNEVHFEEERFGSIFNQSSARAFKQFITSSRLLEVKMEGYSFTWSHPPASKMSKLDRFLVSDGIFLAFPAIMASDLKDAAQKAKVKWAIKGDENSKFFHGIINKRRAQLAIRGVFVNGVWHTEPSLVKDLFLDHFATRFKQPASPRIKLNMSLPNCLSSDQTNNLDRNITNDEIRAAVWDCGENKSPRPDGFTFEFFRHFWDLIGSDFCAAVNCFFESGSFLRGCNPPFIALIPKVMDAKFVTDFRPISLIGSVYKVVTKILTNRLSMVISDLVSNTQSAFVKNRQILDGPFILNKALAWCKRKKKQALIFKVDFAKAYDSVRWDFLFDVLHAFDFGLRWCTWIRDIFSSNMASILVNGSPTVEFSIFCGLKQGDPLAPFLFILVMETLHISVSRAVNDGVFKGLQIYDSMDLSHLFYADDVIFLGEWSDDNLANLIRILQCFQLASGLKINVQKSQVLGVSVSSDIVKQGASIIGCFVLYAPFKYLGVTVGDHMSRHSAWLNTIQKVR